MNKYTNNILIFLIFLIICISCEDESHPDELPPITQTGENTLGCMIENEIFVPEINRFQGPDGIRDPISFASVKI